jgi:hypothetical protein
MRNAYKVLMNPEGSRSLGRPEKIILEQILKSILHVDSTGTV